jgi:uncharacterized protein GlcG (DUF336 family)
MARTFILLTGLCATAALVSAANAQAVRAERTVSLDAAHAAAATAVETCRKNGFRIAVTVVDAAGEPRVQMRDDGALPHTVDAAFKKAYTARTFRQSSADFTKATETATGRRNIINIIALSGGLPIKAGEDVIGGIGVAGAPGANGDESCAQAGIDKIKDQLK